MTRYAGLEIDRNNLRMAIFEGSPKKYSLVDFVDEEIATASAEERRELIRGILSDVLARKENRGMSVVCGIDTRSVILREISVPYTKDDTIAKTIRFEAESHLHSLAIEDVIIDYLKCGESQSSSRLLICAALKTVLDHYLEDLKSVNVDPSVIELDATALATAFANTPLYSGEQNVLLLEIEKDSSRMVFLEKDRIVKIRSVWGQSGPIARSDRLLETEVGDESDGTELDANIEERFKEIEKSLMTMDRAEDAGFGDMPVAVVSDDEYARLTTADLDPDSIPVIIADDLDISAGLLTATREGDPLERLFTEIERTFAAYVLRQPIDLVVVTGSCAEELEAVPRISERFEVDVVPFDIGDSFPVQWEGDAADLNHTGAVACGLGLRALDKGITGFDLRKDEFKFERRFEKLMPSLALIAVLLAAATFLWAFSNFFEGKRLTREVGVLLEHQRQLCETFFEEEVHAEGGFLSHARRKLDGLSGRGKKKLKIRQYLDPLEMMQDIVDCRRKAQPDIFPVWESFDLNPEISAKTKSKCKLILASNDEVAAFETALNTHSKLFETPVKVNSQTDREGRLEVSLELRIKQSVIDRRGK